MFDIGFLELALIGVVALLVIGPERLPAVAKKVGLWVGKTRRFVTYVQADLKEEINKTEELKRLLEEQSKIQNFHEILEQSPQDEKGRVPAERLPHQLKPMESEAESRAVSTDSSKSGTDTNTTSSESAVAGKSGGVNEQAK